MLPDECRGVLSDPVLLPLCLGVGLLPLGPLALLFADDLFGVLFLFQILHGAPALRSGLFEPRRARLVGIALQHVQRVDRPAAVRIAQPELGKRALVALLGPAESGGFSGLSRRLESGVLFPALSGRFGGLLLLFACGLFRFSAGSLRGTTPPSEPSSGVTASMFSSMWVLSATVLPSPRCIFPLIKG